MTKRTGQGMTLSEIGNTIKEALRKTGRSQTALARELKMSYTTINTMANGRKKVSGESYDRVAEHLGINLIIKYPIEK